MARSYRALGPVALMLLVVAPLTLFAVLSLFEDESADSIKMSLDGVQWEPDLQGALLDSPEPWEPGEARSAIVYVHNGGPDPVDAGVVVTCRSADAMVTDGYLTLTAQVDDGPLQDLPVADEPQDVEIADLASDGTVPVVLTAVLAETAPIGTTLDGGDVRLGLRVTGTRTDESGAPSLLDATGAQLWLAPILLVAGAAIALLGQARRRSGRSAGDHTTS